MILTDFMLMAPHFQKNYNHVSYDTKCLSSFTPRELLLVVVVLVLRIIAPEHTALSEVTAGLIRCVTITRRADHHMRCLYIDYFDFGILIYLFHFGIPFFT